MHNTIYDKPSKTNKSKKNPRHSWNAVDFHVTIRLSDYSVFSVDYIFVFKVFAESIHRCGMNHLLYVF